MASSVLIVGSEQPEWLEGSYARAFTNQNWVVHFWNPIKALHKVSRGYRIGRLFSNFVHVEPWLRKANLDLLQTASRLSPDLILVIGTSGIRGATLAQIRVRVPKSLLYCIYPDSPHNLDSDRIHCLPFFDRIMASSPAWLDAFRKLGASQVCYLPFAADAEIHRPLAVSDSNSFPKHDLVFIGNWRLEREALLAQLVDFDLFVWGENYWKYRTSPRSALRTRWGGRAVTGLEYSRVCAHSRILLNILDPVTWPGPNMRTFELAACRAFSLAQRTAAVLELFREGETIECFDSIEEAREKVSFYLRHDVPRERIAHASYDLVVHGGHTYGDRVKQISQWVCSDKP